MQQATKDDARFDELIGKMQQGRLRMSEKDALAVAGKLYTKGEFRQAEVLCTQLIKHRPGLSDAHSILGVSLNAQGKGKEGVASLKRAIKLNPKAATYRSNLGEVYRQQGNLADAITSLQAAIRLDPNNAQAHNNLGIVRFEGGAHTDAIEAYRQAIRINPNFAEAHNNLGNALRKVDGEDEALQAYQTALTLRQIYPEAYNNLGTLLQEQGKSDQAERALKTAIQQNPRYLEAYNNLATIHFKEKRDVEALGALAEALKISPVSSRALILTARVQMRRANYPAAEKACRIALKEQPDNAEALTVLGAIMHELDRFEEAIDIFAKAIALRPDLPEARNYFGATLKSVGRLSEAREQLLKSIEIDESLYGAYMSLNDLVDFSKEKALFRKMKAAMEAASDQRDPLLLPLHYAYAKGLDDNKQYEKALEHYIIGGELKRKQLDYAEADTLAFFKKIQRTFPTKLFKNKPFQGIDTDRLIFIVGMPRSGSTLVEQILSSHSDIHGAGEVKYFAQSLARLRNRFPALPAFPEALDELSAEQFAMLGQDYLSAIGPAAGDSRRITDKLLTNYFFVGLLHLLFPQAKFINTRRDPIDACLSTFTKLFKDDLPHSYDLGELGRYYREYDMLMKHWEKVLPKGAMHVVNYEDVVADTERTARELIEFSGLDWQDACLDFHNSSRPVKTASVAQVRKPIYNTSVKRWERYGEGLRPLIDAIGG